MFAWVVAVGLAQTSGEIVFQEGVGITVAGNKRTPVRLDPVEYQLATGAPIDFTSWASVKAGADGKFTGGPFQGGYAQFTVNAPKATVMLLEASGSGAAYVNGVPRVGDPYSYGYASLPVALKQGPNEFLFATGRGSFSGKLVPPPAPISLDLRDSTLPDIRIGQKGELWAAVIVRNATDRIATNLSIRAGSRSTAVGPVPAFGIRKVGFRIEPNATGKYTLIVEQNGRTQHKTDLTLRLRKPGETYKQTFVSEIDGSVQYYGVNPSRNPGPNQAMYLSLHGASVEAIGQADAYSPKGDGYLVCPTNRRPYGFDWEDIGRLDALEVLHDAETTLKTDPTRTYLTGHSMGGHGTWQLGVLFPGRFAAIAPSAGWIAFSGYGGGKIWPREEPLGGMLNRANSSSDTLKMKSNYAQEAVYVLHGDADDNVPVTEAREMRKQLEPFHRRLDWYEQPGAGHWWDNSPEPGADCVDWLPIFDLFSRTRVPSDAQTRHVDFMTPAPGISAVNHWVTLEQQFVPFGYSRADLTAEPNSRRIFGRTFNLRRMTIRLDAIALGPKVQLDIDENQVSADCPKDNTLHLLRGEKGWAVADAVPAAEKNPTRYGGFKDVFRNRVLFVYGTSGTPQENEWAINKARFDAESLWYRGNGSVDVISDREFLALKAPDRNVLLYGNADTNAAWATQLGTSPIQVSRGKLKAGTREIASDSAAAFFIRPRPGSTIASVAAIAPTGLVGARWSERVPLFQGGSGLPDLFIGTAETLKVGLPGLIGTGYFNNDWTLGEDVAWN